MKVICRDRRQKSQPKGPEGRLVSSVSADIDRLLALKSYEDLEVLEKQVRRKLSSNEPVDVDYWEHLLRNLIVWKAKAKLRSLTQSVIDSRLQALRTSQCEEAKNVGNKFSHVLQKGSTPSRNLEDIGSFDSELDAEPMFKTRPEDRALKIVQETDILRSISEERLKVEKMGFVPMRQRSVQVPSTALQSTSLQTHAATHFDSKHEKDVSRATTALYEREAARGVDENEEIFGGEEEVGSDTKPKWAEKYQPRKPRYLNRVQMGYEWNKYNQTHYDHDNPPPKVVQGYKFNIFYPDLIDKTKAPTYKIERENGRKRGQSFAPAGEEDTCLIRFTAGPPYEDIGFRIVDKEWDFSAKRDRGFRSHFDKVFARLYSGWSVVCSKQFDLTTDAQFAREYSSYISNSRRLVFKSPRLNGI